MQYSLLYLYDNDSCSQKLGIWETMVYFSLFVPEISYYLDIIDVCNKPKPKDIAIKYSRESSTNFVSILYIPHRRLLQIFFRLKQKIIFQKYNIYLNIQMGPKKKPDPGAQDNAQKVEFLTNKVKSLQYKVGWQQERADRSKIFENELRKNIVDLDGQFTKQKEQLLDISCRNKMSQQYEKTQKDLKEKVTQKRTQLSQKQQQIVKSKQLLKNCRQQYEQKLKQKQKQLNQLKQKMQDMSIEFSRMLRETLEKMQERIQLQQWDNQSDPQLIKKMKDMSEFYSS